MGRAVDPSRAAGRFAARPDVITRTTSRGLVVWPLDEAAPVLLSPLAALVWEQLDVPADLDALTTRVRQRFEGGTAPDRARITSAVEHLVSQRLLEPVGPSSARGVG